MRMRQSRSVLTVVLFAVVIAACLLVAQSGCAARDEQSGKDAAGEAVPKVVGLTESGACSALERAGFEPGRITTEPTEPNKDATVLSQSPAAGATAKAGASVNLVVAVPREESGDVIVPDLVGGKRA